MNATHERFGHETIARKWLAMAKQEYRNGDIERCVNYIRYHSGGPWYQVRLIPGAQEAINALERARKEHPEMNSFSLNDDGSLALYYREIPPADPDPELIEIDEDADTVENDDDDYEIEYEDD